MIKINFKSDFDAILTVCDAAGNDLGFLAENWTANFYTRKDGTVYTASHIDYVLYH